MRSLLQPRTPLQQQCPRWPHNIQWGLQQQQQQQETLKTKSGRKYSSATTASLQVKCRREFMASIRSF